MLCTATVAVGAGVTWQQTGTVPTTTRLYTFNDRHSLRLCQANKSGEQASVLTLHFELRRCK